MKYSNILEEEIKNKVAQTYFDKFDCTKILGKIDFAVKMKRKSSNLLSLEDLTGFNAEYLLWAEAKQKSTDIVAMLTQLVLTIGKARTFDEIMPPPFLGCYDNEKIAFVPYSEIQHIFYQNDFNWKITPSNTDTKEFRLVYEQISKILNNDTPWNTYVFDFERDEKELRRFIRENFIVGKSDISKIKIDKNNFIIIYNKWLQSVKPSIAVNWDAAKKAGIIDGDFYLADLLSSENASIKDNLFVLLHSNFYEIDRKINETGLFTSSRADFSDNQKAHNQFWARYERPPHEEYWDYIVNRRDLLVPQDVRERKGSFFTPQIWVELSQRYLADVLGKDWQDEYYVWDCAAGTGNLLAGLTNKDRIFASTLDKQDVDVVFDRINNGANLWKQQVFQFDFLNDEFLPISKGGKLPDELYNIISDENKRKKLVIYINPPYAEGDTVLQNTTNRKDFSVTNVYSKYKQILGAAAGELFIQFLVRIYFEIPNSKLAMFSKLKHINSPKSATLRKYFKAECEAGFIVKADTFDNVTGHFPIAFLIWNFEKQNIIENVTCDILNEHGQNEAKKTFQDGNLIYLNDWLKKYYGTKENKIAVFGFVGNDFQNQKFVFLTIKGRGHHENYVNVSNLINISIYFTVRHCIEATWLNDRDQFLHPNKKWENDIEFHNDCLAYTIFHGQNRISAKDGVNHWIPFTEAEVAASYKFESHFMTSFISGKIKQNGYTNLFENDEGKFCIKREFSPAATAVFDAGRELWRYYHGIAGQARNDREELYNVNASLYDIREYFQERNDKGKMNNTSTDAQYTELIGNLRKKLNALAQKIEPKVYEYGFLKA
ncbi:hypothetical protein SAMD00024442_20_25 [Candidatus Symbiothrix dinenymphae]|nr:hypothetical protein SAMD00024442_20_25 [Candidatus Symbiothrix dinenymphae]